MKEAPENIFGLLVKYLRNPHLWIIAIILALLTIIHYHELFTDVWILERIGSVLGFGLTRHTLERILYILPVVYGAIKLGTGAGISLVVLAAAAMIPRVYLISPAPKEAIFETGGVILMSTILVILIYSWHKGTQRLAELEATQRQLNLHIRRLSMLHTISSLANQSLQLDRVKDTLICKVAQIMDSQAAWFYLRDEQTNRLKLFACSGLTPGVKADMIQLGEEPEGRAAQLLLPVIIEDSSLLQIPDAGLVLTAHQGMKSELVVPLVSEGIAVGTLGIGFNMPHRYPQDEIDLLTAVAGQFSITVENAYLYQKERLAAEELRISEENYRAIFEYASDAIWTHDLNSKILAVNSALCHLTGYEAKVLIGTDVSVLFPDHGLTTTSKETHEKVLRGDPAQPYEHRLVKKDGSEVILQIGTSLITRDGDPWAFQHIARDITEERRVQDNLRLYAQKVSQAQEAERKRIARELHDDTAQGLVVISRHLDDLALGKSSVSAEDIREEVRKVLEGVRHFAQELRPSILDDLGLISALKWLASDLTKNFGIIVETEIRGVPRQFYPESELMLFRITQEALTNVRKHSQATRVSVGVYFSEHSVKVIVRDNGKGFEMPSRVDDLTRSGKLGLAGMQERAQLLGGNLFLESRPGKGTALTVEVPL